MANGTKTDQELAAELRLFLEWGDQARTTALAETQSDETTREEALRREQVRLTVKYGAESVRAKRLSALVDLQPILQAEVKAEHQRSRLILPAAPADAAVLHGRVVDPSGAGIAGLTVRALAAEGETKLAADETDDIGAFTLALAAKAPPKVLVEVRTKSKRLFLDKEPQVPAAGKTTYREIVIAPETRVADGPSRKAKPAKSPAKSKKTPR